MNVFERVANWTREHPARAAVLAGWYQQGCTTLGAAIAIPFVLRLLGKSDAGLWFSLQGFLALLGLADFGFSSALTRQVAHSLTLDRNAYKTAAPDLVQTSPGWAGVSELYGASRLLFWRITVGTAALVILLQQIIFRFTKLAETDSYRTSVIWYAMGVTVLLSMQTRLSQSFLDGLGYMYLTRFIAGTYGLLWNAASVVGLLLFPGLISMSFAVLGASILQYAAMHLALGSSAGKRMRFDIPASRLLVSRLWRISLPFGVVNSGAYLVGTVQVPLLGLLLGAASVAPYYLAARLSQTLHSAVQQLTAAQMPLFTQDLAAGNSQGARQRMRRTGILAGAFYLGSAAFLFFLSPWLVRIWVGPGQYVTTSVLTLISLNFLIAGLTVIPGHFVLAAGSNPFAITTTLQGVATILGMILLCPNTGLAGIPLSSLIAGGLTNYWYYPYRGERLWANLRRLNASLSSDANTRVVQKA
jgi:O-antigen/teichoic acid export membrane protein